MGSLIQNKSRLSKSEIPDSFLLYFNYQPLTGGDEEGKETYTKTTGHMCMHV